MKLYSILLGWIGILTKSCVSPQVLKSAMGCASTEKQVQKAEAFA